MSNTLYNLNGLSDIPADVLNLLWFKDGPRKNYVPSRESSLMEFFMPMPGEPSCISVNDVIGVPISPAPQLGYYPSFSGLSPNEKATYLHWLKNISQPIDIGYVFIFYYGLERFMCLNPAKLEPAINMILRLRQYHKNPSFQVYSKDSLIGACIIHHRIDLLDSLLQDLDISNKFKLAYLAAKNLYLSASDIIEISSTVGFTNKRYIKNHPKLFREILDALVKERYSELGYPLTPALLKNVPKYPVIVFANISLEDRTANIPDITQNTAFKSDLLQLLRDTHERIKNIPMKERN